MIDNCSAPKANRRCVLVVEDDIGLQKLIRRRLEKNGYQTVGISMAHEAIQYIASLTHSEDRTILLLDQYLPDMTGLEMIQRMNDTGCSIPFIVMTGQGDERLAVQMMKMGAVDYLIKDLELIDYLPTVLNRLIERLDTEEKLKWAEAKVQSATEEQRILLDHMRPQVWYLTDPETYGTVNVAHADFLGVQKEEIAHRQRKDLLPQQQIEALWKGNETVFLGRPVSSEEWIPHNSGELRCISITKNPVFADDGSVPFAVCSAEDITERRRAEKAVLDREEQIRIQQGKFQKELLLSMIQILELYDLYTRGHSENVARFSAMIAEKIDSNQEWIRKVYWAGLIHDIGKLLVPTNILNKPSKLTDEEFELIKMHPVWGAKVLNTSPQTKEIGHFVLYHHERYDGEGYLDGIQKDKIPLASRIIAVADAYDAMTSMRSYRAPLSVDEAEAQLIQSSGSQFDPDVVNVFLSLDKSELMKREPEFG